MFYLPLKKKHIIYHSLKSIELTNTMAVNLNISGRNMAPPITLQIELNIFLLIFGFLVDF
jgi:predicted transcriptional regulator YheO